MKVDVNDMKFIILLFLMISCFPSIGCPNIHSGFLKPYSEIINDAEGIYLVRVAGYEPIKEKIKNVGPVIVRTSKEGVNYKLKVIDTLKGIKLSSIEIKGILSPFKN